MTRLERVFIVIILLFIAVCAIYWIGSKYHSLLAIFEMLIGIVIGMVLFIPNNEGGY